MKPRTATIVVMLLLAGTFTPIQAQWGLNKIVKKAKKTNEEINKTVKEAKETKDEINNTIGISEKEENKTKEKETSKKSPWQTTTSQQNSKPEPQQEKPKRGANEPTDADLQNMKNKVENILYQYSYMYDVKENNGKKYLVSFHKKDLRMMLSPQDVKRVTAVRDALEILGHYKAMPQKDLDTYKKRAADIIEGNNNTVKAKREEAYKDNIWKSHKSKAPRLAEAKARIKKARTQKLNKNIKVLDMAIEDNWDILRFNRGIYRVKKESLEGDILYYDFTKKKYMRVGLTVSDEYYIDHPNDKEKRVNFTTPRPLDIKQVPARFRKY